MAVTKRRLEELYADLMVRLESLGQNWKPAHERLLGVPAIHSTEVFSSWCWRIATHFNISLREVQNTFGLSSPSFWFDSGRVALDLERIAETTMVSEGDLDNFRWPATSAICRELFACLTVEPINRRPIYRYCEICLAADPVPYIRKLWRLGCAYVCPSHACVLRDNCPNCHWRVDLSHSNRLGVVSIRQCSRCGEDLCSHSPIRLPDELHYPVLTKQIELVASIAISSTPTGQGKWWPHPRPPHFKKDAQGRIDPFSPDNAHSMLGQLLTTYFDSVTEGPIAEDTDAKIGENLIFVPGRETRKSGKALAIGFDGPKMFPGMADQIAVHLNGCQDLSGGTYWWSIDRGVPFAKRFNYGGKEVEGAIKWVASCGRSVPTRRSATRK